MKPNTNKLIIALVVLLCLGFTVRDVFSQSENGTAEVTAIGVGMTAEDAQKNAIINAVQQVVGLYVDSETFVKNEQLVVDQVLSVSSGFVSSFVVKSPPRKRLIDGLFETTIKAVVQKTRVAEQLSKTKIVSVPIDAQDAWAEAFSRLKNAQDGRQLLEKFWPELPLKLLRARLVDDSGQPIKDASRPAVKPDANSGLVWCAWNVEVSYDADAYFQDVAPRLKKIFDAICLRKADERIGRKTSATVQAINDYNGRLIDYGGRRIAIAGSPIRWLRPDSFSLVPERKEQNEFNLALITTTDKAHFFETAESYVLEVNPFARILRAPTVGNTLVLKLIKSDGSVLLDDKVPLNLTYLECSQTSGQRRSQHNIPITGEPADVFLTSLLSEISGGCGSDARLFCTMDEVREGDYSWGGRLYKMWLLAPEFSFRSPISADSGFSEPAVTDRLLLRYETQLHPDDLKDLKEVQLSFTHQKP